jgi:hypothetical protein
MVHYRLYFHNEHGHFIRATDIDVEDVDAARAAAQDLDHAFCIEIWHAKERVALVEPRRRAKD